MAGPLLAPYPQEKKRGKPRTVVAAKPVKLVMVTYYDEFGEEQSQLAVVGDQTVHLLDGKATGFSTTVTPQGRASDWMKDGVFQRLKERKLESK